MKKRVQTRKEKADPMLTPVVLDAGREWVKKEIQAHRNDGGLPTRFVYWLVSRWPEIPFDSPAILVLFLRVSTDLRLRARVRDDRLWYEIAGGPDIAEIVPLPGPDDLPAVMAARQERQMRLEPPETHGEVEPDTDESWTDEP